MRRMQFIRHILTILIVCWGFSGTAQAQTGYPTPQDNYINDYAGLLDDSTRSTLRQQLAALETESDIEMTVVVIDSFQNYETGAETFADFATGLFNTWGIGDAARNNGVLFLVGITDRQVRLELGTGYLGEYDSRMGTILQEFVTPRFREDDYAGGISAGVAAVIQALVQPASVPASTGTATTNTTNTTRTDTSLPLPVVGGAVAAGFIGLVLLRFRGSGRHSPNMKCPTCRKPLDAVIDEKEANKHLTAVQRMEQRAHNTRYQVWVCENGHVLAEAPSDIKRAKSCPQCQHKTYTKGGTNTVEPTEEAPGSREYAMYCINCGYRETQVETIPRLKTAAERAEEERIYQLQHPVVVEQPSTSSWDDYDSSSSSSSSDSDSGGSDFGGGSSDGDGAGSDW